MTYWQTIVNMVMIVVVPYSAGDLLMSCVTVTI